MNMTILSKCNNIILNTEFPFKKQALSTRKVFNDLLAFMDFKNNDD